MSSSNVETTSGIREEARTTNNQLSRRGIGTGTIKKPKQFIDWYQYPLLVKQYNAFGYKLPFDTTSTSMTRLLALSKEGTRQSIVTNIVRQQDLDTLGIGGTKGAKKEFLVYYTSEMGRDRHNELLPSCYISHGLDYLCAEEQVFDDLGDELTPKLGRQQLVHNVLWSRAELDKALEGQDTENRRKPIAYSVALMGGKSHAGYTYEEMANLSFKELLERGRLGRTGEDLSVQFSSLSTSDKLYLQKDERKQ